MAVRKLFILWAVTALTLSISCSCDREWIPTPDPDSSKWSNQNQTDEPDEPDEPDTPDPVDTETWTTVDGAGVALGETHIVDQPDETFMKSYWPDGKLIPVKKGSEWQLFWSEATDALTVADTPYPEDHISKLTASSKVWGKEFSQVDGFNDGGSWFIGIFPLDDQGHYVGFFHAESHWTGGSAAHKSIGVAYSDDYGATWRDPQPIITDTVSKPEEPEWTGLGDGCVIWDSKTSRYICYYQAKVASGANTMCMAASSDVKGAPGTWKKWDGSDFTIEACDSKTGLGGENIAIEEFTSLAGANPSVMWNTFLNKWVMVYATWGKRVVISYSEDAVNWSKPVKILGSTKSSAWYPNLIGEDGDLTGGEIVKIYWSHNQDDLGRRDLGYCQIKFIK